MPVVGWVAARCTRDEAVDRGRSGEGEGSGFGGGSSRAVAVSRAPGSRRVGCALPHGGRLHQRRHRHYLSGRPRLERYQQQLLRGRQTLTLTLTLTQTLALTLTLALST